MNSWLVFLRENEKAIYLAIATAIFALLFSKFIPYISQLIPHLFRRALKHVAWLKFRRQYCNWLVQHHLRLGTVPSGLLEPARIPVDPLMEDAFIHLTMAQPGIDEIALPIPSLLTLGRRTVILGDPGSGKTTLLRFLCLANAWQYSWRFRWQRRNPFSSGTATRKAIPIIVFLNQIQGPLEPGNLIASVKSLLPDPLRRKCPEDFFERILGRGNAIVLLDGLDELQPEERRVTMAAQISGLVNASHPNTTWIVTSRIVGYNALLASTGFGVAIVQPLSPVQVERFVRARYYHAATLASAQPTNTEVTRAQYASLADDLIERIQTNLALAELTTNPMLITLVTILHSAKQKIPRRKALLYRDCLELLAERWDVHRGISNRSAGGVGLRSKVRILSGVAWALHSEGTREIRESQMLRLLSEQIQRCLGNNKDYPIQQLIYELEERCGLLISRGIDARGERIMAFSHLSFQEYLASEYWSDLPKTQAEATLERTLDDVWWREVIVLYVSRLLAPEDAIRAIHERAQTGASVSLLLTCGACVCECEIDRNAPRFLTIIRDLVSLYTGQLQQDLSPELLNQDEDLIVVRNIISEVSQSLSRQPRLLATLLKSLLSGGQQHVSSILDTIDLGQKLGHIEAMALAQIIEQHQLCPHEVISLTALLPEHIPPAALLSGCRKVSIDEISSFLLTNPDMDFHRLHLLVPLWQHVQRGALKACAGFNQLNSWKQTLVLGLFEREIVLNKFSTNRSRTDDDDLTSLSIQDSASEEPVSASTATKLPWQWAERRLSPSRETSLDAFAMLERWSEQNQQNIGTDSEISRFLARSIDTYIGVSHVMSSREYKTSDPLLNYYAADILFSRSPLRREVSGPLAEAIILCFVRDFPPGVEFGTQISSRIFLHSDAIEVVSGFLRQYSVASWPAALLARGHSHMDPEFTKILLHLAYDRSVSYRGRRLRDVVTESTVRHHLRAYVPEA